jgi:hypothetical protein
VSDKLGPPEQLGPSALASETALDSRFLAALPGLAATNWETLAPVAYLASSMGRPQKTLTQALYAGLLAADFKHVSKHAGVQAAKSASSFEEGMLHLTHTSGEALQGLEAGAVVGGGSLDVRDTEAGGFGLLASLLGGGLCPRDG